MYSVVIVVFMIFSFLDWLLLWWLRAKALFDCFYYGEDKDAQDEGCQVDLIENYILFCHGISRLWLNVVRPASAVILHWLSAHCKHAFVYEGL